MRLLCVCEVRSHQLHPSGTTDAPVFRYRWPSRAVRASAGCVPGGYSRGYVACRSDRQEPGAGGAFLHGGGRLDHLAAPRGILWSRAPVMIAGRCLPSLSGRVMSKGGSPPTKCKYENVSECVERFGMSRASGRSRPRTQRVPAAENRRDIPRWSRWIYIDKLRPLRRGGTGKGRNQDERHEGSVRSSLLVAGAKRPRRRQCEIRPPYGADEPPVRDQADRWQAATSRPAPGRRCWGWC